MSSPPKARSDPAWCHCATEGALPRPRLGCQGASRGHCSPRCGRVPDRCSERWGRRSVSVRPARRPEYRARVGRGEARPDQVETQMLGAGTRRRLPSRARPSRHPPASEARRHGCGGQSVQQRRSPAGRCLPSGPLTNWPQKAETRRRSPSSRTDELAARGSQPCAGDLPALRAPRRPLWKARAAVRSSPRASSLRDAVAGTHLERGALRLSCTPSGHRLSTPRLRHIEHGHSLSHLNLSRLHSAHDSVRSAVDLLRLSALATPAPCAGDDGRRD